MNNIFKVLLFAISISLVTSCGKIDMGTLSHSEEELLSLSAQIVGESQVFTPTLKGPYKDGDIIEFKFPSPIESPVDLSKIKLVVSLENDCFVEPKLPGMIDLSAPYKLNIKTSIGDIKTFTIVGTLVSPICTFKKDWFKNGNDLGYEWPVWISSIAVSGDNFVLYDGVENYSNSYIKVYDSEGATLIKQIKAPTTFISQIKTDDAGHIIAVRQNVWGAGFMLYYYDAIDSNPKLLLDYSVDAGCKSLLGNRFNVVGNLVSGRAYVYALAGNTFLGAQGKEYYRWEFNDGELVEKNPKVVDFSTHISGFWETANIQRLSTADDSDIYLSYYQYTDTDTQQMLGSHIYCFKEDLNNISEMNRKNFDYKLLGFRVFKIDDHCFMAILTQAFGGSSVCMKVFDITNKDNWNNMQPDNENYNDFLIFESEQFPVNNINQWGDVAVKIDGNKAYIYGTIVSNDKSQSGVAKFAMTYYPSKQ